MTSATTAEAWLDVLEALGVEHFIAVAGTDFPSIIDAFARREHEGRKRPTPILVPHEFCAVSMAHGSYLAGGKPGVVMVHTSVGTANAIGAVMNAWRARVPLVLAAGRSPITEAGFLGSRELSIQWAQEVFDQAAMLREFVKWDYELRTFAQLEDVTRRAFSIAMEEPRGPVYLTLPREVLAETHPESTPTSRAAVTPVAPPGANAAAVAEAAERIAAAERPLVVTRLFGERPERVPALVAFAEAAAVPVIEFPFPPYVNFPGGHELHLGYELGDEFETADLVIVLENDTPWYPSKHRPNTRASFLHIGIDPLFRRYPVWGFPVDVALAGDPAATLTALRDALAKRTLRNVSERRARVKALHDAQREKWRAGAAAAGERERIGFEWIAHCLDRVKTDDMVVINEYDLSRPHIRFDRPGSLFGLTPVGCLGWGMGAGLGVKLAKPEATIVAVIGDGSYVFNVPTACHMTSAAYDLPMLTIVCNNGGWGATELVTRMMYPDGWAARTGRFPFSRFPVDVAWEMIVRSCGGHGETVRSPRELPEAIARALRIVREDRRQVVLDVRC